MAFVIGAWSCSSQQAPFNQTQKNENLYYQYYRAQSPDFREVLKKSAYHFLRGTLEVFVQRTQQNPYLQQLVRQHEPWLLHGDFHLLQMGYYDGQPNLDDFDEARLGPWWFDMLRMESSALLMAQMQTLPHYQAGACLQAYQDVILKNQTTGWPLRPRAELLTQKVNAMDNEAWQKALPLDKNQQTLSTQIEKTLLQSVPGALSVESRVLKAGVGSFKQQKFISLVRKEKTYELWELKEQQNLNDLQGLTQTAGMACPRVLSAARQLGQMEDPFNPQCVTLQDRSFLLFKWSEAYWSPGPQHFVSDTLLRGHVAWMCSQLAMRQKKQSNTASLRKAAIILRENKTIHNELINIARQEAEAILQGYRMALSE